MRASIHLHVTCRHTDVSMHSQWLARVPGDGGTRVDPGACFVVQTCECSMF